MSSTQSSAAAAVPSTTPAPPVQPAMAARSGSVSSAISGPPGRSDSISSISTTGRSNSVSSISGSPPTESPISYWSSRRESRVQFASLMELKRSTDPAKQALRDSIHDQRRTPGMFGRMWHNYVYGAPAPKTNGQ